MRLLTDRPDFFNDISEEIRLFLPNVELELLALDAYSATNTYDIRRDTDCAVASLSNDGSSFIAKTIVIYGGREFSYVHTSAYCGETPLIEKRYAKRCLKVSVFRCLRLAFPDVAIPWGSLTGIRPTRLLRELELSEGKAAARRLMLSEFDVTPGKLELAEQIVGIQKPVLDSITSNDVDVYIGIPFCRTRCLYCSFASCLRTAETDMQAYLSALERDISLGAAMAREHGLHVRALYLGGGTPTVLTSAELSRLLEHTLREYDVAPGTELTVEAGRPDTITEEKLVVIRDYGATRISINPQSMCDSTLKAVGRSHTAEDIIKCFRMARRLGFDSINMDLIAGLPGEDEDNMKLSMAEILKLNPDCLTIHTLAVKRSSRLHEHLDEIALPDASVVERMTAAGAAGAAAMGMRPYYMYRQKYMAGNMENVGYSRPDRICIYNIDMMEDALSIIAHGAGAMTKRVFANGGRIERVPNPKDINTYINKLAAIDEARRCLFSGYEH